MKPCPHTQAGATDLLIISAVPGPSKYEVMKLQAQQGQASKAKGGNTADAPITITPRSPFVTLEGTSEEAAR